MELSHIIILINIQLKNSLNFKCFNWKIAGTINNTIKKNFNFDIGSGRSSVGENQEILRVLDIENFIFNLLNQSNKI